MQLTLLDNVRVVERGTVPDILGLLGEPVRHGEGGSKGEVSHAIGFLGSHKRHSLGQTGAGKAGRERCLAWNAQRLKRRLPLACRWSLQLSTLTCPGPK